jgi:hypothetical protein
MNPPAPARLIAPPIFSENVLTKPGLESKFATAFGWGHCSIALRKTTWSSQSKNTTGS